MCSSFGFLNCTKTVADSPGARLVTAGTVMYGDALNVPVAFNKVTPSGNEVKTIWKLVGVLIVFSLMFVIFVSALKISFLSSSWRFSNLVAI